MVGYRIGRGVYGGWISVLFDLELVGMWESAVVIRSPKYVTVLSRFARKWLVVQAEGGMNEKIIIILGLISIIQSNRLGLQCDGSMRFC